MKIQVREIQAHSILTPQKMGNLAEAFNYSLNPYSGCAFACSYCYVPKFPNKDHEYFEWGSWVNAKMNAPELIAKERTKIFGSRIFFSSATDPYQYIELKYRLSRKCLELLQLYQPAKVMMHTRSHLILQDIELLKSFGDKLQVGVSITTDDESVRQEFEPQAPSIKRRLQLIKSLREAGIRVHASIAPLLPCDPDRLISLLEPFVEQAWVDEMRWTEVNTRPELLVKYKDFFHPDSYKFVQSKVASAFLKTRRREPIIAESNSFVRHQLPSARRRKPNHQAAIFQPKLF